ncbi:hypothetical protein [Kordiimonas aestuarii]|uniref:hypothetical protein n=1 Tax=Kordiimonas aestuarii TaxID=1005925 RepID=UPI0021D0DADE|nr:hypothetical protein [Kordiimonas aestuarii]
MRKEEFLREVAKEITQAKSQERGYGRLHVITICVTIILGGVTTYLLATGYQNSSLLAVCAAIVTTLGTFEKTFGFGGKKSLYRQVKTEFEHLEIDAKRLGSDADVPQDFFDTFKGIRNQKLTEG